MKLYFVLAVIYLTIRVLAVIGTFREDFNVLQRTAFFAQVALLVGAMIWTVQLLLA